MYTRITTILGWLRARLHVENRTAETAPATPQRMHDGVPEPVPAGGPCLPPTPTGYQWMISHDFAVSASGRELYCERCGLPFIRGHERPERTPIAEAC